MFLLTRTDTRFDRFPDVLEQFHAPPTSTSKSTTQSKQKEESENKEGEEIDEEEFARQFAAEMERFMKGLVDPGSTPSAAGPVDPEAAMQAEALRKAWEQLLVEDLEGEDESMASAAPPVAASGSNPKASKSGGGSKQGTSQVGDKFQKAVSQTMEKLKESDDSSKVRRFPL